MYLWIYVCWEHFLRYLIKDVTRSISSWHDSFCIFLCMSVCTYAKRFIRFIRVSHIPPLKPMSCSVRIPVTLCVKRLEWFKAESPFLPLILESRFMCTYVCRLKKSDSFLHIDASVLFYPYASDSVCQANVMIDSSVWFPSFHTGVSFYVSVGMYVCRYVSMPRAFCTDCNSFCPIFPFPSLFFIHNLLLYKFIDD